MGNLRNLKRQNANATVGDFLVSLQRGKAPLCGLRKSGSLGPQTCGDAQGPFLDPRLREAGNVTINKQSPLELLESQAG